jgi:uncharacterized protein (TIGR00251 family)
METINAKVLTKKRQFSAVFDKEKDLLIIQATEKPQDNKANKEIIKGLKKLLKTEITIVSGLKNNEKRIQIDLPKEQIIAKLSDTN